MVLRSPHAPMVSVHPDKFVHTVATFLLTISLHYMADPRLAVLFMCPLRCRVVFKLKMVPKAAGKMECLGASIT